MIRDKPLENDKSQWPVFSFAGGPTQLPRTVLKQIKEDFLSYKGIGLSILEVHDQSKEFSQILTQAEQDLRDLYSLPEDFRIYFSQGGATLIFESLVYNLLGDKNVVSYANTGHWSEKAIKEAGYLTNVHETCKTQLDERGRQYIPDFDQWSYNQDAAFLHYCDNETAEGLEFQFTPKFDNQLLITDVSSNFLTRRMDWNKLDGLYSHGQKNVGISGSSILILRQNLFTQKQMSITPSFCDFKELKRGLNVETQPVMPIYVNGLMFRYIKETGGIDFWDEHSQRRSNKLYKSIDNSHGFFKNPIVPDQRSRISVVFDLEKQELTQKFFDEAKEEKIIEIKGHRSRGGCRVNLYVPVADIGIDALVDFMDDFANKYN